MEKWWGDENVRREKGWRNINIKKINFKNNYKKIGKKNDNNVDVVVNIYIYRYAIFNSLERNRITFNNQRE